MNLGRASLALTVLTLTGCWVTSWTTPVATFPAAMLVPQFGLVSGQVLVLPFWRYYRDSNCRFSYFFDPPILLSADELPNMVAHLHVYEHEATAYLFMEPTYGADPNLVAVYVFYPDGHVVWASYRDRDKLWSNFHQSQVSARWQRAVILGLSDKVVDLSAATTPRSLIRFPPPIVPNASPDPICGTDVYPVCCIDNKIRFKTDRATNTNAAIRYLESLPIPDTDDQVEVWNPIY